MPTGPKGEKRSADVRALPRCVDRCAGLRWDPDLCTHPCIDPAYVRVSESPNCRKFELPRLRTEATVCRKDP